MNKSLFICLSLVLVFIFESCTKKEKKEEDNPTTGTTPALTIGQSYQGGVIACIFDTFDIGYVAGEIHGLIAAPNDQSTGIFWHATNDGITGATGDLYLTGNANTNAIIALYGTENNAAKLCNDLVLNGYNDWYLPAIFEFGEFYNNRQAIGGFSANSSYWTSTEYSSSDAAYFDFVTGFGYNLSKDSTNSVRACRSF